MNVKEIEVADLAQMKEKTEKKHRIIDIRQPAEQTSGVIPDAEAVPMDTLPLRLEELNQDETVILVCRSGARSAQACLFLQQLGYENVYNLRGGMMAWSGSGNSLGVLSETAVMRT